MAMFDERSRDQGNEVTLREKAREALRAGTMPNRRPDRSWGGRGMGADCTICSAPVTNDELEFELEFARCGDDPGQDTYHVHVPCFRAWEFERDTALSSPSIPSRRQGREPSAP